MAITFSKKTASGEEKLFEIVDATTESSGLMTASDKKTLQELLEAVNAPATVQSSILEAAITANTDYTVPEYVVGNNRMDVFLDGVLCVNGSSSSLHTYSEVGTSGTTSTTIKFHDTIAAGHEITVKVR